MSWEDYREFELVYRENARLVYRFLVSRGCPPQEAEDLTQDTFVKALLHIHRFKGGVQAVCLAVPDRKKYLADP